MGFFSFLTSSSKALDIADKLVDGTVSGIDKLFFTDEEKAEMSQKGLELWIEIQKVTANESSIRSITRRILAIFIVGDFLLLLTASAAIYKFDPSWAQQIYNCANALTTLVLTIAAFYFGYYAAQGIIGQIKNKENKVE